MKTTSDDSRADRGGTPAGNRKTPRRSEARRRSIILVVVALVALVLVLDLAAAPILRSFINRQLEAMPGYTGHVEGARLSLVRGRLQLMDVVFTERGHEDDPALARIPVLVSNVSYLALLRGNVSVATRLEKPVFTIVKASRNDTNLPDEKKEDEDKSKAQKAAETRAKIDRWQTVLQESFPVEITALEITDGTFRFIDRTSTPNVDMALSQFRLTASGLRNRPTSGSEPLPATIDVEAVTAGEGRMKVHLTVDPFARQPRFDSQFELRALSLPAMNPFLLAYAKADVGRGTFEFDSEIHAANGAYSGYVKPFFKDLDFRNATDKDKNPVQRLTEKAVGAVAGVLKNDEEQKVATRAPFEGNFSDNDVDIWTTIVNLLRNAFVQGIREGFEGQTPSR